MPQKSKKRIKIVLLAKCKTNGAAIQQTQDKNKKLKAVFLTPNFCETYPPKTQEILPLAIIIKDNSEMLKFISGCKF